jgi:uncharacterized membrane protein
MKRALEDNTVSVLQKAIRYLQIPVTNSTIKESLKSHPDYPTLKSVCDVLNDWKVDNFPLKYQPEELKDVAPPYIVHLKTGGGQIAFVTKIEDEIITYYDSFRNRRQVKHKEFYDNCSGAIILLNPDERSSEPEYRKKRQDEIIKHAVLPVIISTFIIFAVVSVLSAFNQNNFYPDKTWIVLLITKITGTLLSLLLVLHEFDIRNSLTDKLCHLNKSTDCNTILNDTASRIFGWFGWADAGSIYFISSLLVLLQCFKVPDLSLLAIISGLAMPYPMFSVYYQGFVLKKWCPLCLGVQMVLVAEFILLLPQFSDMHFSFNGISIFILTFLTTGIIYSLTIMYLREMMSNEVHKYKYLSLKKNPLVLTALLFNQKYYDIPVTDTSLIFGSKDSPLKITAFLSLNCSHCARAFNKIKDFLKSEVKIGINVVLVTSDKEILNTLYYLNKNKKENEAVDLLDRWYSTDLYSRQSFSENYCIPDITDIYNGVRNDNIKLFKECNVIGTPTLFINGYMLPNQYDIDDFKYFSEIIIREQTVVFK